MTPHMRVRVAAVRAPRRGAIIDGCRHPVAEWMRQCSPDAKGRNARSSDLTDGWCAGAAQGGRQHLEKWGFGDDVIDHRDLRLVSGELRFGQASRCTPFGEDLGPAPAA